MRGPVDAAMAQTSDSEGEHFKPVQVPAPQKRFAPPVATQEQDASQPTKEEKLEDEDHVPVSVPKCCSQHVQQQVPAETEPQNPLRFLDLEPADAFLQGLRGKWCHDFARRHAGQIPHAQVASAWTQ